MCVCVTSGPVQGHLDSLCIQKIQNVYCLFPRVLLLVNFRYLRDCFNWLLEGFVCTSLPRYFCFLLEKCCSEISPPSWKLSIKLFFFLMLSGQSADEGNHVFSWFVLVLLFLLLYSCFFFYSSLLLFCPPLCIFQGDILTEPNSV